MRKTMAALGMIALAGCSGAHTYAGKVEVRSHRQPGSEPYEIHDSLLMAGWYSHVAEAERAPRISVSRSRPRLRAPGPVGGAVGGGGWSCIVTHESGGDYRAVNPNGHYGAYQFSDATWASVGGHGHASDASPTEQDQRARMLQARSGWGQWSTAPGCGL